MTTTSVATDYADHTRERADSIIHSSPNALKMGVFAPNLSGGASGPTFAPAALRAPGFAETRDIARLADRTGFEAFIPVTRWKGFGGPSRYWDRSWETMTWGAAIAEATERMHVFSTCVPHTIHPVTAAKMGATVDHVSDGRWGLNVVAGWLGSEFDLFGSEFGEHSGRYRYAQEWFDVVRRTWTESEPFDFEGEFFHLRGVVSEPKPVQAPVPPVMNAGQSPQGRAFAVRNADLIFINLDDAKLAEIVASLREDAAAQGKKVSAWGVVHVTARATRREAEAAVTEYAERLGDRETARRYAEIIMGGDASSQESLRINADLQRSLLVSGANKHVVGTPQTVAEELIAIRETDVDGVALVWHDYRHGIRQFAEEIEPVLFEAGLRETAGAVS